MTKQKAKVFDLFRLRQVQASRLLGVTVPTIVTWEKRGMPRNPDGSYDGVAIVAFMRAEFDARLKSARQAKTGIEESRGRKLEAEAGIAEISLARQRQEMVPRSQVVAGWIARYSVLQGQLMALQRRLTGAGIGRELATVIETEIRRMLTRLADRQVGLELSARERAVLEEIYRETDSESDNGEAAAETPDGGDVDG